MLGLDVLVSIANVVYLCSYSVRDIMWLRVLSVLGGALLMPYYYLQPAPLWAPIGWNVVFIAINGFWIALLVMDRRPVPFSDEERHLYRLAFPNFREREAFNLLRRGAKSSVPVGTTLLEQGEAVKSLTLIAEGEVSVEVDGEIVDVLSEGRLLGATAFLKKSKHFEAPVTVRVTKPCRVLSWTFSELETQFQKDTRLEIDMEASLGLEISRFLQKARTQLHAV